MQGKFVGIKYQPHEYIRPFHAQRKDYRIRAIVTGYGGGKTYAGCMEMIQVSGINKGVPNVYIEPTHQMVKDILEPEMINILDDNKVPYQWNKTEHNFFFPLWNGHVWLRSGDKPEKLKGINVGMVGIDEPFIQDEEIYKIAISRARHPRAIVKGLFLTGTPEQLNWGYELIQEEKRPDTAVYRGSTRDNVKYVGEDYLNFLLNHYSEKEVKAYVDGEFINLTSGLVYYSFGNENIIEQHSYRYNPKLPLEIYCDFNVDLMCWSIGQSSSYVLNDTNNKDVIFDNVTIEGQANTRAMCELLKEKRYKYGASEIIHRDGHHRYIFYVDIAGTHRSVNATMSSVGIIKHYFPKAKVCYQKIKNVRDRVDATNGRLFNYMKNRSLLITNNNKILITDLRKTTWEHLLHRVKQGKITHPTDGVTYGMYWKYPLRPKAKVTQA